MSHDIDDTKEKSPVNDNDKPPAHEVYEMDITNLHLRNKDVDCITSTPSSSLYLWTWFQYDQRYLIYLHRLPKKTIPQTD